MKKQIAICLLAISATCAANAQGTMTWDWTFTGSSPTTPYTPGGSGTFVTSDQTSFNSTTGETGYLVESVSGTFNGQTISSLEPIDPTYGYTDNGHGDNLVISSDQINGEASQSGITFDYGSGNWVTLYSDISNLGDPAHEQGDLYGVGTMSITAVPEPSTVALAGLGAAVLLAVRRRK